MTIKKILYAQKEINYNGKRNMYLCRNQIIIARVNFTTQCLEVWIWKKKSGYGLIQLFSAQKQFRYNFHSHYLHVTHIIYMLVTMEKKQ